MMRHDASWVTSFSAHTPRHSSPADNIELICGMFCGGAWGGVLSPWVVVFMDGMVGVLSPGYARHSPKTAKPPMVANR